MYVCFWNHYQHSTDYRYRSGSFNRTQMQTNTDDSWAVVLAHQEIG